MDNQDGQDHSVDDTDPVVEEVRRAEEVIAREIETWANVSISLRNGCLQQRAILLLLHDLTKLPMRDIKLVLDNLPKLKSFVKTGQLEKLREEGRQ